MIFSYKILLFVALFVVVAGCDNSNQGNNAWNSNNENNLNNLPDGGIDSSFRVTEVDPNHGPVGGGTHVTIRGFGFDKESRIFFGDMWADPNQTVFIAQNRMECIVPAGHIGRVPVTVMRGNGDRAALEFAYTYDRYSIDPASGSMSGGTFIRITSSENEFTAGTKFFLGDNELTDANIVSPGVVVATTPAHSPGEVSLKVTKDGSNTVDVDSAFEYYDTTDPAYGGMSGDPIAGSITVTILNTYGHTPVEGAFVLLGADLNSPFKGTTDPNGQITFSSPELQGMQMVTAAMEEFEIVSMVGFDSSEITIFLTPKDPPPSPSGGIPGVPSNVYSHISGSVIFKDEEFKYSCDWDIQVPDPVPAGYHRALKIYQSMPYYDTAAPEIYTLTETSTCIEGFGYPFSITLWPGAFAIYALAGYENATGDDFIPVSYGILRHLVVGPGQTMDGQIAIEHHLSDSVSVNLINPPPLDPENGPVGYNSKLILNLGADGYIMRNDSMISSTATGLLVFPNQMSLVGPLSDASYSFYTEAHNNGAYPFSQVFINHTEGNPINVDSFLTIPTPVAPVDSPPVNGRFNFAASPIIHPTFVKIMIKSFPEGDAWWTLYLNGELASFILPDLDSLTGVPHKAAGDYYWHIQSIYVPYLDFNNFTYRYLSKKYWNSNAADGAKFRF